MRGIRKIIHFYKICRKFKFEINQTQPNKKSEVINNYIKEKANVYTHYKEIREKDDDINSIENIFDDIGNSNTVNLEKFDISYDEFIIQSDKYFDILISAFTNLIKYEKKVKFERKSNSIEVNVAKVGLYIIARENETNLITLTTPINGLFKYKFDFLNKHWISIKDNHILDELLMREFCHHSGGLLIIDN